MGSPISVVLAEIVMQKFELTLNELNLNFCTLLLRFVDDIFAIIKSDILEDFFNNINSLNSHLKFTKEVEQNNCLPFLDVLVTRNNGCL